MSFAVVRVGSTGWEGNMGKIQVLVLASYLLNKALPWLSCSTSKD